MTNVINIFLGIFFWIIIIFGHIFDILYLWILIIVNVILNYLTFSFKNVYAHISNVCVISAYIIMYFLKGPVRFVEGPISISLMIFILYMIYIIISINLTKKESKFYVYTMYFFLVMGILYMIFVLYDSFAQREFSDFLLFSYPILLKFVLLINNIYLPYHYLDNKYLKYTIIFISLAYFAVETYHGVLFVLNPDP